MFLKESCITKDSFKKIWRKKHLVSRRTNSLKMYITWSHKDKKCSILLFTPLIRLRHFRAQYALCVENKCRCGKSPLVSTTPQFSHSDTFTKKVIMRYALCVWKISVATGILCKFVLKNKCRAYFCGSTDCGFLLPHSRRNCINAAFL